MCCRMTWKAMAGALLLTLSLILLGWGAEGQENGGDKKMVPGSSTVNLGQNTHDWRPLIHTTVNLSEIRSIKSSFEFRTFDPEGLIFYGDTKNGDDWFILSLKDGVPLIQINKGVLVSVAGTPRLNDGKWHTMEVSNQDKFVNLEVDGTGGLVVGIHSKQMEEAIYGKLRLALGGMLISKEKMVVQFNPKMDGCVRKGNWLNLTSPWVAEADELQPCYENIQPGSYFPGTGFAIFNTSDFQINGDHEVHIELWGDFSQMDGTLLSIKADGEELMFSVVADKNTKNFTFTSREEVFTMKNTFKRLQIKFLKDSLSVVKHEEESSADFSVSAGSNTDYLSAWRDGHLAIGGLLGENADDVGSQFLTGCLEKIQVQGKDLDLDLARVKHVSVSSHSCPA
ncbi:sex hormone-binding globulin [Simochromis diagramma]|uniref:sex hormone-binding globulin n=1 Tax=Simochromis diagramma TaxID=43689 RepID=UPI001A7E3098|nr:sex hormone-binding globulin [Simochromis diagramma]